MTFISQTLRNFQGYLLANSSTKAIYPGRGAAEKQVIGNFILRYGTFDSSYVSFFLFDFFLLNKPHLLVSQLLFSFLYIEENSLLEVTEREQYQLRKRLIKCVLQKQEESLQLAYVIKSDFL